MYISRSLFPFTLVPALIIAMLLSVVVASLPLLPSSSLSTAPNPPARLPLAFIPNLGQSDASIELQTHTPEGTLSFMRSGVDLTLPNASSLRVEFTGAHPSAIRGVERLPGVVHSLIGRDAARWRTNIPTYASTTYDGLYPGIDLRYDGQEGALKGTYTVAPHADPSVIRWQYKGARSTYIDPGTGDMRIILFNGQELVERAPIAWQVRDGQQVPVAISYTQDGDVIGFTLGAYHSELPLIIDPTLEYSTYLGGSGAETGYDIAVDMNGNVYLTGDTTSNNFPTLAPFQDENASVSGRDAFVTKLNPQGQRVFSTYFGGNDSDSGLAIALDSAGNIYLTGQTSSRDFPIKDALQPAPRGSADAFVVKLNPSGSELLYATFFGGSGVENVPAGAAAIGVDSQNNMIIAGLTGSDDLPTTNAAQNQFGGNSDAFVAKLRADGQALEFASYLGGELNERPRDIAIDGARNIYVTGYTTSSQFPTKNAYQAAIGSAANQDVFVSKFGADGAFVYSTYLGGIGTDEGYGIAVDSAGSAYLTGSLGSPDFPATGTIRRTGGPGSAFLAKLSPSGGELAYSVHFGGNGRSAGTDIALDSGGSVYVTGGTDSTTFPVFNASQQELGGASDAFVLRVDSQGCSVIASTYFGGSGFENDQLGDIAVDDQGNAYIAGTTGSADLPLKGAQQAIFGGSSDAFAAKIQMNGSAALCQSLKNFLPMTTT